MKLFTNKLIKNIPDSIFLKIIPTFYAIKIAGYTRYNKWTPYSCKYFKTDPEIKTERMDLYTSIFTSKINSSILAEIPSELLFYLLEY